MGLKMKATVNLELNEPLVPDTENGSPFPKVNMYTQQTNCRIIFLTLCLESLKYCQDKCICLRYFEVPFRHTVPSWGWPFYLPSYLNLKNPYRLINFKPEKGTLSNGTSLCIAYYWGSNPSPGIYTNLSSAWEAHSLLHSRY